MKYILLIILFFGLSFSGQAQENALSLDLDQAVTMAVSENLDLAKAALTIERYEQIAKEANSRRWATLDFKGSYSRISEVMEINLPTPSIQGIPIQLSSSGIRFGDKNDLEFSLNLMQPLYTGGALKNWSKAVQQDVKSQKLQKQARQNQIVFQTKKSFFSLIQAQEFEKISRTAIEQIEAHLKDVENFLEQGQVTKNEVLKVQVKLSEAELQLTQAQKNIELAKIGLLILLNKDLNIPIKLNYETDAWERAAQSTEVPFYLNRKAETKAFEFQITGLQLREKSAKGAYYPNVGLFSRYVYGKPGLDKVSNEWMDYWIAGVTLQWNIWDWGKKSAQKQQLHLAVEEANLGLNQLKQNLSADAERTQLNLREAQKKLEITNKMLDQAEENYRIVSNQYQQGVINNTEFLDAQTDLTRSRLQKTFQLVNLQIAKADFERARAVE